ncbi:ABC transporter ATP-binding protein/permease [Georgenia sp. TF02-10]|uniref:ABC transporter ATP-binding protein n=1 Tax=Georgenia sp. TF02-10 TaxID=2917725 RepID=UPI001FA78B56|nr:ABC transporter ATP-binding protein [Georgenia sp. TF02-10]UNX53664.1 ABC transporter ATP-binding protein/permease [Georgenia sp. TF02-10]
MSAPADLRSAAPALRRTLAYLRPYLRPHRRLVAGGFVALFAEVLFRLLEPWPLKLVIDAVVAPGAAGRPGVLGLLVGCGVAVVVVAGLRALAAYLTTVAFALAGTRATTAVRADVYAHALRLSLRFHSATRTGDLITRLVSDVGKLRDVAVTAAMPLLGNVVTLAAMLVVMVVLDWRLALVVLAALPVFALQSTRSARRITGAARQQRRREGDLAGAAGESFGAVRVVQAYSLERQLEARFAVSSSQELRDGVRATRLSAGLERRTDLLVGVATGVVLAVGGWSVLAGRLTPGELVVFVQYLKGAFKPMRDLAKYTGRIAKAGASGERIVAVVATRPEVTDAPGARPLRRLVGEVRLDHVTASYGDGTTALQDVTLRVRPGARVGLVGPSGSGKSTLAALLVRLQDPVAGTVRVDGHDLRDITVDSLRAHLAVVLQESVLFAGTVRENIRMGRADATDAEVEEAARSANAHEFVQRLPQGYDTVVGERGDTLSGGQRQRLAIARAMLRDASVIILDEATTGLDPASSAAVLEAVDRLTAGRTTFLVSHVLADVLGCDEVVVLDRGQVVEHGTPADLLAAPGSRLRALAPKTERHLAVVHPEEKEDRRAAR